MIPLNEYEILGAVQRQLADTIQYLNRDAATVDIDAVYAHLERTMARLEDLRAMRQGSAVEGEVKKVEAAA